MIYMSNNQELLNALTITLPSLYLIYNYNNNIILLLLSSLIHLPFSFIYHLLVIHDNYGDKIDNNLRRLDQSFQHISIIIFSYAISKSILFLLFNIIFNFYSIYLIWNKKTSNDMKRWQNICLNGILYKTYLLYDQKYYLYVYTIFIYLLCGFPFIPNINILYFNGYGHALSHVLLILYADALIKCTS